jgi:hypothetical protein
MLSILPLSSRPGRREGHFAKLCTRGRAHYPRFTSEGSARSKACRGERACGSRFSPPFSATLRTVLIELRGGDRRVASPAARSCGRCGREMRKTVPGGPSASRGASAAWPSRTNPSGGDLQRVVRSQDNDLVQDSAITLRNSLRMSDHPPQGNRFLASRGGIQ